MYDYIKTIIPEERILFHEPMSKHTTFRVGGEADCLIMIHEEQELTRLIRYLNQIEEAYFIVGNGSNLLVGDKGYRGVVLKFDGPMGEVQMPSPTRAKRAMKEAPMPFITMMLPRAMGSLTPKA